jgi:SAM-dependent methyltransferase
MDVVEYNRNAWNHEVAKGNKWTVPVSPEEVALARQGRWQIVLTPSKPVPEHWFPGFTNADVLCLASGGGQQGPILAAAGARVTVLDNSPAQLARDRLVATRESLAINTIEADMTTRFPFPDEAFSLIVHPVSNLFIENVRPVWNECFRVLKPGGILMAGMINPAAFLFDQQLCDEQGVLQVKYRLPYADCTDLDTQKVQELVEQNEPLEFSHTLDDLLGGQLKAGFVITDFFEDSYPTGEEDLLSNYMPIFFATRALKHQ